MKFAKVEDIEIARVQGIVHFSSGTAVPALQPVTQHMHKRRRPLLIGEAKLTDLKQELRFQNIDAEFAGQGVLVCNGNVAIRKVFFAL